VVEVETALVIHDARDNELVRNNPAIVDLNVVGYLGVPIRGPDHKVLGSLCAIHGSPRNWSADDRRVLEDFASIVEDAIVLRDRATDAFRSADTSSTLAREYTHRLKNFVAVAMALLRLSSRDTQTIEELSTSLQGRLSALAQAYDVIDQAGEGVELRDLLASLLAPYGQSDGPIELEGPAVVLPREYIAPISLIVHELATNSAKYGAIANTTLPQVSWSLEGNSVKVAWFEDARRDADAEASDSGFGEKLLEIAARQLEGKISRQWNDDTITVAWSIPHTSERQADQPAA
jgi:two-component sensor histidine kinase